MVSTLRRSAFPRSSTLPKLTTIVVLALALALSVLVQVDQVRAAPALFVVNTTDDIDDGTCDLSHCSLREAINAANAVGGPDDINFDIPGPGPHTVQPLSPLPTIDDPVVIDGTSEPDFMGTPVVELDGSMAGPTAGLSVFAGSSTVRALVINRFDGDGIFIGGNGGNLIEGNYIGTDISGLVDLGNLNFGIIIGDVPGNVVGGPTASARNVISGNEVHGIGIFGGNATGNVIQGNFIGVDVTGATPLGNNGLGIHLDGPGNILGGVAPGEGNVVSANGVTGIVISSTGPAGNILQGNFIGTDVTGSLPLGNGSPGIHMIDTPNNTIGGVVPGAGNVISANGGSGIDMAGAGCQGNVVQGNRIGTDSGGSVDLGNAGPGIGIWDGSSNVIGGPIGTTAGGPCTGACNVISGNDGGAVLMEGNDASGNVIQSNYVGTDVTGTSAVGNGFPAIGITNAPSNVVGGSASGEGNLISGNDADGVWIGEPGASGNLVQGNFIGVDITGMSMLSNGDDGVQIASAPGNTIGGTQPGAGNVISGNMRSGVGIRGADATGNVVSGNLIGTDVTGTLPLGNQISGVRIHLEANNNTVGGTTPEERNVISANFEHGVKILEGANSNLVQGNFIGTDATGTVALGNTTHGVFILEAWNNTIGGTIGTTPGGPCTGACNLISGNERVGVSIAEPGADGNFIEGNFIGTDVTGTLPLGNGAAGVLIAVGPEGNTIGGGEEARNVISANGGSGVNISNGAFKNAIQGNFIGTDAMGTAPLGNLGYGVVLHEAPDNTIGGTAGVTPGGPCTGACNVISSNDEGVILEGPGTTGNRVEGNYIGTDVTGTSGLGHLGSGVVINDASKNTVGGTTPEVRNIISDNGKHGVAITGVGATGNQVLGNFIGTDVTGTAALGNGNRGVFIVDAHGNIVGGTVGTTPGGSCTGACNLISGNGEQGVFIEGPDAFGNRVLGNYIGTDVTGTTGLGNLDDGVKILGAPNNVIGGTSEEARNIISGNREAGIVIRDGAFGNEVLGNYIGTDASGTVPLGNSHDGVFLAFCWQNTVGGNKPGAGNLISGNGVDLLEPFASGVNLFNEANGNRVLGNLIGTDITGTTGIGNLQNGVQVFGARNLIGGTDPGDGNLISGNHAAGVLMVSPLATDNLVQGNLIGTDVAGVFPVGNGMSGVALIGGANSNIIGGGAKGRNIISGNEEHGAAILDQDTWGNIVAGNFIGTDVTGTAPLGNAFHGVEIFESFANVIGGLSPEAGNVISANQGAGVGIAAGATGNVIQGNMIGTDLTGSIPLGNRKDGVVIGDASGNTIGGIAPGAGNTIAFNGSNGVNVVSKLEPSVGNAIDPNSMYSNGALGIDLNGDGPTPNDPGDPDEGPNNLQNFPEMALAEIDGSGNLWIEYLVDSVPGNSAYPFLIEFFVADADDQEGERFVGDDSYPEANAQVPRAVNLGNAWMLGVNGGDILVSTATDDKRNTSEFSSGIEVIGEAKPPGVGGIVQYMDAGTKSQGFAFWGVIVAVAVLAMLLGAVVSRRRRTLQR